MRTLALLGLLGLLGLAACATQREVIVIRAQEGAFVPEVSLVEEHDEREAAEWHAHTLRMAVETLAEADRHDVAEMMERALHAHELEMQGREDAEAREIIADAPSTGNIVEGLMVTREILVDQGRHDAAHRMEVLEHRLRGHERPRRHEPRGRHEHPDMGQMLEHMMERQRHMAETLERFMERVEKLEAEREKSKER